jgi:hypothetical protein
MHERQSGVEASGGGRVRVSDELRAWVSDELSVGVRASIELRAWVSGRVSDELSGGVRVRASDELRAWVSGRVSDELSGGVRVSDESRAGVRSRSHSHSDFVSGMPV